MQVARAEFTLQELIILETDQGKFKVKPLELIQSSWSNKEGKGVHKDRRQGHVVLPNGVMYIVPFVRSQQKKKGQASQDGVEVLFSEIEKTSVHIVNFTQSEQGFALATPAH